MEKIPATDQSQWLTERVSAYLNDTYPTFLQQRVGDPDRIALVCQKRSHTYEQLHAAVDATAQNLVSQFGVSPGDRVMINMENSDFFVIIYLAVQRAGAIAVPINPKLVEREISFMLSDAEPVLCVFDDGNKLEAIRPVTTLCAGKASTAAAIIRTEATDSPLPLVTSDSPATIFYTSGTTGAPKGVVHTHETLIAGAFQNARGWDYDYSDSITLAVTPLFHVAAHAWFYPVLAHQGTLVIAGFKTEDVFQLIERYQVDGMGAVPAMLLMMIRSENRHQYDLRSVRNIRFGASPMPPDKLRAVQELFPNASLNHGMGQTESGGTISVLPGDLAFSKNGSTGFVIPGCEVRIVDDTGNDVPKGHHGEILAQGPNVMRGYFNLPDATAATLDNGWLHTGDIGYFDEDNCIWLVDRKKDMILRGGENIYSVEVENVIMQHSGVEVCAVVGSPDAVLGEKVCAIVVPRAKPGDHSLLEELVDLCREQLAYFKVPEDWRMLDDLPRTATGKVQKASLRKQVSASSCDPEDTTRKT
jgi:acyl-CoA synthetase (AMP-forming)/AMP-acid ligase II